jgi:hypothetical protein
MNLKSVIFGFLWTASIAYSQTTNASLVGDVVDPQHRAVPAAAIAVINSETGVKRLVESDAQGQYRVFPLLPGSYDVTVSAAGFRGERQEHVVIAIAEQIKVDFQLAVGEVVETVNVASQAPLLQTQDGSVGGIVTGSELTRLPVNGRNYTTLMLLMPGTNDQGGGQSQGTFSGTQIYTVNGQRRQDNNFTLDGVDNNFLYQKSPGSSPPMDAIEEFKVLNNTSAEFGRSPGANVNVAIKSGTSGLHGSAYEYLRNDALDANDFFNNAYGTGKLPYRQNQYGLSGGGPVILPKIYRGRNRTFWFTSWEGFRQRQGKLQVSNTPTLLERTGNFTDVTTPIYNPFTTTLSGSTKVRQPFPGNIIPTSMLNPATELYLTTVMPAPNAPGTINNLLNTTPVQGDRDTWVLRFDHTLGPKDNVFFRYLHQDVAYISPYANPYIYSNARFDVRNGALGWNHIFGASSVLELRFGYNNPVLPIYDVNTKYTREQFLQATGIQMFQTSVPDSPLPALNASGVFTYPVGTNGGGSITKDHIYEPSGSYSRVIGRHSLKIGGEYEVRQFFQNTANPMTGTATFNTSLTSLSSNPNSGNSVATMLLGIPASVARGAGTTYTQGRGPLQGYYLQDDFRVSSRLTVNLGVRYQYATPPYSLSNQLGTMQIVRDPSTGQYNANLLWASNNPFTGQGPNQGGFGRGLFKTERDDFAPRVGLAYQLGPRTVIRSAYGIFYDSDFFQELLDHVKFYPYVPNQSISTNTGTVPNFFITDPGAPYTAGIAGWAQDPVKRTPYSQQWNFTVQQVVAKDLSLELGYVGSNGRHLVGYTYCNDATSPGSGALASRRLLASNPSIGDIECGFNQFTSNYESLRVKIAKRYTNGLEFNVNYTYGKVLTDQSSLNENVIQDQFNWLGSYGRASFDVRHIVAASYVYEFPFGRGRRFGSGWNRFADGVLGGWGVEGIAHLQSGSPLNIVVNSDRANVGTSVERPNLVGNPATGGSRNINVPWFNTSAFQLQPAYTFGNAGVNLVDGPAHLNWDTALKKSWTLREGATLQFRGEFFDVLNHVSFVDPPSGNLQVGSPSFGLVTSATSARQIQLALRLGF